MGESASDGPFHRRNPAGIADRAVGQRVAATDHLVASNRDDGHGLGFARLEAHRGACGQIQAHAVGGSAIEAEVRIDLDQMIVAADLDRPIGEVGDGEPPHRATGIQFHLANGDCYLAGNILSGIT